MTPEDVDEIEENYGHKPTTNGDTLRLCAALREAWRERDELRGSDAGWARLTEKLKVERDEGRARIAELEKLVGQLGIYGPTGGPT